MRKNHSDICRSVAAVLLLGATLQAPAFAQTESTNLNSVDPSMAPLVVAPVDQVAAPTPLSYPQYSLGPGDQISISVLGYDEFTEQKVVNSDGTIIVPLLGTVMAAGKTPAELDQHLEQQLNQYLVEPEVAITLLTQRPVVVTVAGEVQRPGPVRLRSLTNDPGGGNNDNPDNPTLTTALVQAGGVTRFADIRQVVLSRYNPNGESEPQVINLWDSVAAGTNIPDIVLQDGDSIFIPRLTEAATLDRRLLSQSSLAPATVRVRVVGEVTRPGEVQIPPNSSLSSAVATAGGPTVDARLSRVAFVRLNEQGQIERREVDLRNLTDEFQVQEGDVVIVPKRGSSSFLDIAARILNPFGTLVNIIDNIGGGDN
ncbi:polysaccharide biosynthesis/export family protein [Leptolyngbya sp. AN02str]|uniref:polysaccharide biosynthesis/export family protein n=1 Tax=Leptolyngbya sp. AN02str TaxID=3423363 RepID=UPI003D31F066